MPKRTISEKEEGIREESPDVIIIYKGDKPLVWESQDYYGDNDSVEFTLLPKIKEEFNRGYAKAVFGDWDLPRKTKADEKAWADMIKDRIDRSPTCDGRLPMVEIYEVDDTKLWDAHEQFNAWMEKHGAKLLPKPDTKGSGIKFEMPRLLVEADGEALKKLWKHKFGVAMPVGQKHDISREILVNMLGVNEMVDVLKTEFEHEPDMTKYDRSDRS